MRGSKLQALPLVFLGLVCLVLVILISILGSVDTRRDSWMALSFDTGSRSRNGLKALRDSLRKLDYDLRINRLPFTELNTPGTLIVVQPTLEISFEDRVALRRWVSNGNTLILAAEQEAAERADSPLTVPAEFFADHTGYPTYPEVFPAGQPASVLTGVNRIHTRWGCRIIERDWRMFAAGESGREQEVRIPLFWLAGDKEGAILAVSQVGRGKVYTLSDPWILGNEGLQEGGNARLVLNMIGPPREGSTVFLDDYYHGFGEVVKAPLFNRYTWAAIAQGLAAIAIFVWHRSRTFGKPLVSTIPPRDRTEYVDAMASLLERGGADSLAHRLLGEQFLRDITRQLAVPLKSDTDVFVRAAGDRGLDGQAIGDLVRKARSGLGSSGSTLDTAKRWRSAVRAAKSTVIKKQRR